MAYLRFDGLTRWSLSACEEIPARCFAGAVNRFRIIGVWLGEQFASSLPKK
jgi:hypothetical protein